MIAARIVFVVLVAGLLGQRASAQQPGSEAAILSGTTETEKWVWERYQAGREADFGARCIVKRDPTKAGDPPDDSWDSACRSISASFLQRILLRKIEGAPMSPGGLRIRGAEILGELDLTAARIAVPMEIVGSQFTKRFVLDRARLADTLSLSGSVFDSDISAYGVVIEGSLIMREKAFVKGKLDLLGAQIQGTLELNSSTLNDGVDAEFIRVRDHVLLREVTAGGSLHFPHASVGGSFVGTGAMLHVVNLEAAKIEGHLDLSGAAVQEELNGPHLRVGGAVLLNGATFHGNVDLSHVNIPRAVLSRSTFTAAPTLQYARLGTLDLGGAALPGLSLDGAEISTELRLTSGQRPTNWQSGAFLSLVNARVRLLVDELGGSKPSCSASGTWPDVLRLNGFTFEQLDSAFRGRSICWHRSWLERDTSFPLQNYVQLAGILRLTGDAARADDVLYESRNRQMREAWQKGEYAHFLGLATLRYTIGYGIGGATFRILYWVIGFTVLGAMILWWWSAAACAKGFGWCLGASLDHLLPIVQLNKEFVDFFDDPNRARLNNLQHFYFAFHALVGYLLGSFVVAALAGVTKG
jgi:uncharacterized protein YjbI with pentapeptide repeats